MKTLAATFALLMLAVLGAADRAWGKVHVGENIASGGFWLNGAADAWGAAAATLDFAGEIGSYGYETVSGQSKWLNRDPIGEEGGENLYGFVSNNAVHNIDPRGLISLGAIAAALLEGAGIVVDKLVIPDFIDDQIIDSYGGPEGFMDETERRLMSDGGALPVDMFKKARAKDKSPVDPKSGGLHDRLKSEILGSKIYKEKRDFILKRLKEGTTYQGFINIDFQDAGEDSLGLAIGGAQLHYQYKSGPPTTLELRLKDTYDFTKKGHAWGRLQDKGYLSTYKVEVLIEEIPCPGAAAEKK